MKNITSLLTAITIGCLFTSCSSNHTHKIAWEYRTTMQDPDIDTMGKEGWELVSVVPHYSLGGGQLIQGFTTYYFKRPIEK
jgi:hypothetical protein